jgi:hypothetical protein
VRRFLNILRLINCERIEEAKRLEKEMEDVSVTLDFDEEQKDDKLSQEQKQEQEQHYQEIENEDITREHFTKPLLDYRKKIIHKFFHSIPSQMCENCHA